ncbi:MAG: 5'-3' exonuclease H3TH domain-containing protein, partial [Patescibacteria group bacterium]
EKEPTFRHKEFKEYQAQRPAMIDELSSQFEKARNFLKAAKIPIYSMPGFEADDVIGTLAAQATENPKIENRKSKIDEAVIVTGDRDILQLVNAKVSVYMPIVGLSSAKMMGEREVVEKMGVSPSQIPDFKALVGDPSDNYPGVAGIGPKTAISLLAKYNSVNKVYKNIKKVSLPIATKLVNDKKNAMLSLRLATIICDVPIKFDSAQTARWDLDSSEVLNLFNEFGFKTLTKRIKEVGQKLDEEKQMRLI